MKANEAPEKLYLNWTEYPLNEIQVEYTRTDAFIEKACEWLSLNIKMLMNVLDVEYNTHDTDIKDFIEDFRRHMKGE